MHSSVLSCCCNALSKSVLGFHSADAASMHVLRSWSLKFTCFSQHIHTAYTSSYVTYWCYVTLYLATPGTVTVPCYTEALLLPIEISASLYPGIHNQPMCFASRAERERTKLCGFSCKEEIPESRSAFAGRCKAGSAWAPERVEMHPTAREGHGSAEYAGTSAFSRAVGQFL